GQQAASSGGLLPRAVGERLDEQPISVCLGDPGLWVRCLAQAASGAEGVFRAVSTLVFHDKKVLSVGARPRLPPRALVRKKVSFQLISTVYGKNNRDCSESTGLPLEDVYRKVRVRTFEP